MNSEEKVNITRVEGEERKLFIEEFSKHLDVFESSIKSSLELSSTLKENGITNHNNFLNTSLFSALVHTDLIVLVEKFNLATRDYEKSLLARFIALTLVEYLDDINALIGKTIKELENNNLGEFIPEYKLVNKGYSKIKKQNESLLRTIRNNSIAHKNKDSLLLAKFVYEIDSESIYLLSFEIMLQSIKLIELNTKVFIRIIELTK